MAKRPEFKHGIKTGRICDWPNDAAPPDEVAAKATYMGSRLHKTYPSPAGPPAYRSDKAKCDVYDLADWPNLVETLRLAIRAKCVGAFRGEFPSRAWAWINGVLHEARLTGAGEYHAFPVNDPLQYPEPNDRLEEAPRVEIPLHRD